MSNKRWADKPIDDSDIERTEEYANFIKELQEYHEKRGTDKHFNSEPELGRKKIDLLKLYKNVVELGGYDKVSDEKSAWRNMAQSYKPIVNNTNAGFLLKTIYYKMLAAYEITTHWGEEPPPSSILEERTAAGGNVRNRTLADYEVEASPEKDAETPAVSRPRRGSGGSPTPDRSAAAASSGRSLREAPPRRVFYQPEVSTPKQRAAAAAAAAAAATPTANILKSSTPMGIDKQNSMNMNNGGITPIPSAVRPGEQFNPRLANMFSPLTQLSSAARIIPIPVHTPLTNPAIFKKKIAGPLPDMQPAAIGAGMKGPSSIHRIMMSIKCGIAEEVEWGLYQLMKFTVNNDVLFSQYPILAESLLSLLREGRRAQRAQADYLSQSSTANATVLNTALVLRNLALNGVNAVFLATRMSTGMCMYKCLKNLGPGELRGYLLDITEAISYHLDLSENSALLSILFRIVPEAGRSEMTVCLKALAMLVIRDDKNSLEQASEDVLKTVVNQLYLPDESVLSAALDFLYQFTSFDDNSTRFLKLFPPYTLNQLCRLCTYNAHTSYHFKEVKGGHHHRPPAVVEPARSIVPLPKDILKELQGFTEPERATKWMRCLFEQDESSDITQIQLWQAYQSRFSDPQNNMGRPILPAADFIKNVSVAFKKASAMVVNNANGTPGKFIIKGIRPRLVPVSIKGEPYTKCKWLTPPPPGHHGALALDNNQHVCGQFFKPGEDLYFHLLESHCQPQSGSGSGSAGGNDGGDQQQPQPQTASSGKMLCRWAKCYRFYKEEANNRQEFLGHLRTHIPTPQKPVTDLQGKPIYGMKIAPEDEPLVTRSSTKPQYMKFKIRNTQVDDKKEPAGVPYVASLVLRNLARTTDPTAKVRYGQVIPAIFKIFEENQVLRNTLMDCLNGYEADNGQLD